MVRFGTAAGCGCLDVWFTVVLICLRDCRLVESCQLSLIKRLCLAVDSDGLLIDGGEVRKEWRES